MNMQNIYKKFEEVQAKKRLEYLSLNMSEETMQAMYDFDKHQLNRNIAFKRRNQSLESAEGYSSETIVLGNFKDALSVDMDFSYADRFFWVEEVSDKKLAKRLKSLSYNDLEILTLITQEGYTQIETSEILSIPYRTLKRKYKKIKDFLK